MMFITSLIRHLVYTTAFVNDHNRSFQKNSAQFTSTRLPTTMVWADNVKSAGQPCHDVQNSPQSMEHPSSDLQEYQRIPESVRRANQSSTNDPHQPLLPQVFAVIGSRALAFLSWRAVTIVGITTLTNSALATSKHLPWSKFRADLSFTKVSSLIMQDKRRVFHGLILRYWPEDPIWKLANSRFPTLYPNLLRHTLCQFSIRRRANSFKSEKDMISSSIYVSLVFLPIFSITIVALFFLIFQ